MKNTLTALAMASVAGTALSHGALTAFSQDFEGMNQADPAALSSDGWLGFANVFDPGGGFLYNYGPFGAPNGTPGFSSVSAGEGGAAQGAQGLVVYSDYNNGDHGVGNLIEANVFQELTISTPDIGAIYQFEFDGKLGDLVAPSEAIAFIKTLDPGNGFALTNFLTIDTDAFPTTWGTYSIDIAIDPGLDGQILQFGFASTTTNFTPSGMQYDNVSFDVIPEPASALLLGLSGLALLRRRRG